MTVILAQQTYVKVTRTVSLSGQRNEEEERMLLLYAHKIKTKYREFSLSNVLDLSYRPVAKEGGILYIHTTQGVFSYQVYRSPVDFMDACKERLLQVQLAENEEKERSSFVENITNWWNRLFRKNQ